ncbi:oligosaccharide flippase family protein [Collinsella tanakaei]|nr:oligosaccharide flippase family protein [Collinsella tanakaei]
MANSLLKKTGIYFIGNVAAKVTAALIVPVYAFFVSSQNLGIYDYYITFAQMLSPLCFLAIWESILRYIMRESDSRKKEVLVSSVIAFCLLSLAAVTAAAVIAMLLLPSFERDISGIAIMSICVGIAQVWQYFARSFGETRLYAASGVVSALVSFGGILVFVCLLGHQLDGLVASYVLSQLTLIILIEIKLRLLSHFSLRHVSKRQIVQFVRFSSPLALNLLLLAFVTGFGRILITNVLGPESNGMYTFAMKFGTILTSLGSIFAMAVVEEAILRIGKADADRFFQSVSCCTLYILTGFGGMLLPIIQLFYYFISTTEYFESYVLVPCFISYGIATVLSTVAACVFQTAQKTNFIAITSFMGAVVTALGSYLGIRVLGCQGVAFGLFLGAFTMFLGRYFVGKKIIPYSLVSAKSVFILFCYFGSCFLMFSGVAANHLAVLGVWLCVNAIIFLMPTLRSIRTLRQIPDSKDV